MRSVLGGVAFHDDLSPGNGEIDPHVIEPSVPAVMVGRLDQHPAAHDAIIEFVELRSSLSHRCVDLLRGFHPPKGNLQWQCMFISYTPLSQEQHRCRMETEGALL